ncbi:NAD(P)H-dependent oxidoreductase [Clostridium transplantifaecale]|uniref:NAD(P)H-dependent oxidoreductase n=1 Tax=Clostridium transplantifaecale TaxID=2479838 RepID=UPI000F6406C1|nr:NAD(P)H-dependent oxidoreductase [Clostridium transplantifaecale]
MKKFLFVDCCIRGEESRTKELAGCLVDGLENRQGIELETVRLMECDLKPLDAGDVKLRNELIASGCFENPFFDLTRQFASADAIIIAAPFWDFSFPSLLRVYLERMCVSGMTFHYNEKGETVGDCRASRMVYVTTRGGYTGVMPAGYPDLAGEYMRALCQMLGIGRFDCLSAEGLDIYGNDAGAILNTAKERAACLLEELLHTFENV